MAGRLGTNELNQADVIRFDILPDDILLDIFDFYMDTSSSSYDKESVEAWKILVHVCRRWRSLVFGSPRRLNLRLVCSTGTRARDLDTLDVWPALPLIVWGNISLTTDKDNIVAALGHSNRICGVDLTFHGRKGDEILAMMQVPFPELTFLRLSSNDETPPAFPDLFLGGSAPRLRYINFDGISFQGLPGLLLSATHLVELRLTEIPPSGYISPDAMAALLSTLSRLNTLRLRFVPPRSRPDRETRPRPPPKRSILPALEKFQFGTVTEYLEDFVALIDAPRLNALEIAFLNELDFDIQRIAQFINRIPKLSECDEAHLQFSDWTAHTLFGTLQIFVICSQPDRQLSSFSQFGCLSTSSTVKDLYIECGLPHTFWDKDGVEKTLWLQLLLPFTGAKNLYLSEEFTPGIAGTLQELVGDRITEVLPSLENIFVEEPEPFEKNIEQFVFARQLSGYPVTICHWSKSSDMGLM